MASVVFVHGIGVRDKDYRGIWPHLRDRLTSLRPDLSNDLCYWGGDQGARLHPTDIPDRVESADDERLERWAALIGDPYWELRSLAQGAVIAPGAGLVPGQRPQGPLIAARLRDLGTNGPDAYASLGLAEHLPPAVEELLVAPEVIECLRLADAIGPALCGALAHAVVAVTLLRAQRTAAVPIAGDDLDRLDALTVTALGGTPMAAPGWLVGFAARLIRPYVHAGLRPVTWAVSAAREGVTRTVTPYLGDVMLYLSRGAAIRQEIARHVARQEPPVHVIAHSLGGIACLDLLADGRLPGVKTLVTVGTQVSYLYQINALPLLSRDEPVPPLPPWVNVYDRHDFLSFPAEPAFGARVVTDRYVHSGVPFPMSHSAYFRNDAFYRVLGEVLP
jgi:hypothetical protein